MKQSQENCLFLLLFDLRVMGMEILRIRSLDIKFGIAMTKRYEN